ERADVCVQYPSDLASSNAIPHRIERVMLPAPWPKSIRKTQEVCFVNGAQDRNNRLLHHLVFQRGNPQRTLLAVRLLDVDPPRCLGSIRADLYLPVEYRYPCTKLFFVLPPRHPIHACRRIATQLVEALRQQGGGDVVLECRELLAPVLPGALAYAFDAHRRTFPALCPACGRIESIPCDYPPSLPRLRRAAPVVRRLSRYYRDIRL